MMTMDHDKLLSVLPDRLPTAHKGNFGRILLLCGSRGYTGAAALAAMGALRVGAGLLYLGVPESIYEIEATKLLEPVVFPLPDEDGMYGSEAIEKVCELLPKMDAVLLGPGIGRSNSVEKLVCTVLQEFKGTVVLDADGINAIRTHKHILRGRTGTTILTPHEGEFERFMGAKPINRVESAMAAAKDCNAIMVLKGHRTVVTDGCEIYINTTGNPGMAVGGSGDVLAGIVIGLVGQGISPLLSAVCGVWLHGSVGDICASELGQYGMLPSDMLKVIPQLLK